ncbi:MAG: diaminopimelate decarboxylase [Propionibacteriaceae bacterium]|jgi:diaminopimelate decarboxylase|nr:diaminopimelate decarboxylase [Propionibacteriaceae bacterium]
MTSLDTHQANSLAPDWLDHPTDVNRLNPAIWPIGADRDADGMLRIQGHRADNLMASYGSPLYVMDEDDFRARAARFAREFNGWQVYYAGKSFLCRAVARWVNQAGLGLDVCSGNELAVALSAGFPPDRIEFHGNNKSVEELAGAIDSGVGRIIVDCAEEIERIERLAAEREATVAVLVRVTTGVQAHTHDYISTGHEDQKFGFSIQQGQAMAGLLACSSSPHLDLRGIHCHIGSQIFDTEGFRQAASRMVALMADFRDRTAVSLPELNLGGGFGIAYTDRDTALDVGCLRAQLAQIVQDALVGYGLDSCRLAIEPGRSICGPAGVGLYTVGVVKPVLASESATRVYVSVDGGMSDNVRSALYRADYTAVVANRRSTAAPVLARVAGKHCESGDILVRDVYLPGDIRPGDIVAIPADGAYARSLASNYNHALKPGVVAVTPGHAYPILRRETLDDLLALDVG